MEIGASIPFLTLRLFPGNPNSFAVQWIDSTGQPLDLEDVPVNLVITSGGSDVTFPATYTAVGITSWSLGSSESLSTYGRCPVKIEFSYGGEDYLAAKGTVVLG